MMGATPSRKQKLALVFGNVPTVEEIDQFRLIAADYDISVISSSSICGYLTQTSYFHELHCIAIPDYDENPTYLPGLEQALAAFDIVVVKERLGLYSYQALKSKWRSRFRLVVWVDNLVAFPAEDVGQMRTIRREVTNGADAFLVQSKAAREVLELEGVESARIRTFLPWVETHVKRNAKHKARGLELLGLKDGDFVVAHYGQVEWEEGLFDLAHAAKRAMKKDRSLERRLRLVFCGIGSFANELRERFVQLGIDSRAVYVAPNRDAFSAVTLAADCMFFSVAAGRDRLEGDPYRLVMAMANELPILASRSPLVEEYIGKHRIDFCAGSVESLADAMVKASDAKALIHNVAKKNAATVASTYSEAKAKALMKTVFGDIAAQVPTADPVELEHQILEIESRIASKQYVAAIDLITPIFQLPDVPLHHQANLYRLIGDSFAKLGDLDQGKNAYIKAIEMDPFIARAYIGLGTVALIRGGFDIAVLHFQKAVSLAPEDEMANLGLGLAFQGMEELKEANRWVVKACAVNPENTAALFTLVKIAYDRQEYRDAETAVRRYLELHPSDHNMMFTLAGLLVQLNALDDAAAVTQKILDADPQDGRSQQLLKQIRRQASNAAATTSNG